MFITPLDERREWYRYHGLLAELLRIELRQSRPGAGAGLHRRAAQWFAERRDMDRAVRHAIAAGDSEQAARWIAESYLQLLEEGRIVTVDGWLDAMGPEVVAADQRLAVVRAWTSHFLGRHADGDAALAAALRAPAVQPMPDGTGSIEASAALIGAAFPGNDAGRMLACAERAFELEAARDSPWRVTVHVLLGFGLVRKGSFDEARGPLSIGVDLALANEMWMDAVGASALLARISLETGEPGRAEQLGRAAVALAEDHDLGPTATGAYARATLGTILVRRGHATEAGELLAGALPSARALGEPLFVAEALIALAQARRMLGRPRRGGGLPAGGRRDHRRLARPRLPHRAAPGRDAGAGGPAHGHALAARGRGAPGARDGRLEAPGRGPPVRVVQHDPYAAPVDLPEARRPQPAGGDQPRPRAQPDRLTDDGGFGNQLGVNHPGE